MQIVEIGTADLAIRASEEITCADWSGINAAEMAEAMTDALATDLPSAEADDLRMRYRLALEATAATR